MVAAALLLVTIGCSSGADVAEGGPPTGPTPAVEAVQARTGSLPLAERLSGVVRAENQVAIYPEISAPVVEVLVRSGQKVERGQPLVRLEDDSLREQVLQSQAAVRLAEAAAAEARARLVELEAQVVRTRTLADQELLSTLELETQEARLDAAQASARQAEARVDQARSTAQERRNQLDNSLVRAPISGHVGQRNVEVGTLADTNSPLFVIGNLESLIVEVPLTEGMLAYIQEGLPVRIDAPPLRGEPLDAELSRISPFLQEGSFSTVGEIDVTNPEGLLSPGMFVNVDVLYGESDMATLVPTSALWEDPATGLVGVWVLPESQVEPTTTVGELTDDAKELEFRPIEIRAEGRLTVGISNVREGDWVVTVGHDLIRADEPVARVRPSGWDRVIEMQGLQREDLLRGFLEKQQRLARTVGAEPPSHQEMFKGGGATDPDTASGSGTAAQI